MPSPIDPDIRRFIDALNADWRSYPPLESMAMPQARRVAEAVRARWTIGGPVMAGTRTVEIETGVGPLRLRLHRPHGVAAAAPALLYLHGGGFVYFSLDTHDRLMREYADAGGFVVVGVDYPLAPEARFPVALDRLVALVRWLETGGQGLGLDPGRIAIGGDSAGANLAVAACLRLRDAGDPPRLRGILSNYGAFSGRCSDAAEAAHGGPGAVLTRAEMLFYFDQYLGTRDGPDDPFACPLVAPDLAGLPPVHLVIPERDLLAEQSLIMADRLRAAGVAVDSRVYPGATHSFLEAMSIAPVARAAIVTGARWVAERLAG